MLAQKLLDKRLTDSRVTAERCALLFRPALQESEEEFMAKVEAFVINSSAVALSMDQIGSLESYLHDCAKKVQSDSSKGVLGKRPAPSSDRGALLPTVKKLAVAQSVESAAPGVKLVEQSFSQSSGVSYEQRTGSGQLVASFTPRNTPAAVEPIPSTPGRTSRCTISYDDPEFPNIFLPYRFMYTSIEERAIALERHHLHLQKVMCSAHGIAEDSLQPVGSPSQELVWCSGRICSENPEGRINMESILLEGSRKESGGRRVSLDLKEVDTHFSVFPGQIVLVQGINSSGRTLVAKRIIDGTDPPKRLDIGSRSGNVHIMMASGPFTTSENLDYQPIRDFLGLALSKSPDVIVLCGPFVDVSHPKLNEGSVFMEFDDGTSVPASYETVFIRKIVKECLESFYDDSEGPMPHTQIVLIPSLLDGHHECVYPQPPFGDREAVKTTFIDTDIGSIQFPHSKGREKKVHLLSNPCMFEIDGFVFGVATNDILFSLSCDEASLKLGGNRLPYLASHLIRQNSFAPQFPVPPAVVGQLDWRQAKHWSLNMMPDFLLLPSKLNPIAKDYNGSLIVNPGLLTKGKSGGTFLEMKVLPNEAGKIENVSDFVHAVIKRI